MPHCAIASVIFFIYKTCITIPHPQPSRKHSNISQHLHPTLKSCCKEITYLLSNKFNNHLSILNESGSLETFPLAAKFSRKISCLRELIESFSFSCRQHQMALSHSSHRVHFIEWPLAVSLPPVWPELPD